MTPETQDWEQSPDRPRSPLSSDELEARMKELQSSIAAAFANPNARTQAAWEQDRIMIAKYPDQYVLFRDEWDEATGTLQRTVVRNSPDFAEFHSVESFPADCRVMYTTA